MEIFDYYWLFFVLSFIISTILVNINESRVVWYLKVNELLGVTIVSLIPIINMAISIWYTLMFFLFTASELYVRYIPPIKWDKRIYLTKKERKE